MEKGALAMSTALRARVTPGHLAIESLDVSFAHAALQLEGDTIHALLAFLRQISPLLAGNGSGTLPAATAGLGDVPGGEGNDTLAALHKLTNAPGHSDVQATGGYGVAQAQQQQQVTLRRISVSGLRLVFSFAAPRDRALRVPSGGNTLSRVPVMLLSAAGVTCANFTVRTFNSGEHAQRVSDVVGQYTGLVKEAVFTVRFPSYSRIALQNIVFTT